MKYTFSLWDYYDVIDEIYSSEYYEQNGPEYTEVDNREDSVLYALYVRVVIPRMQISVREGVISVVNSEGEEDYEYSVFITYPQDEKEYTNYLDAYSNTTFGEITVMLAKAKGLSDTEIDDLECFIDTDEYERR